MARITKNRPPKVIVTGPEIEPAATMSYTFAAGSGGKVTFGRLLSTNPVYKGGGACCYYSGKEVERMFMNRQFVYLNANTGLTTFTFEESDVLAVPIWDIPLLPQKIFARNAIVIIYVGVYPERCVKVADYNGELDLNDDMKRQICGVLNSNNTLYVDYEDYTTFRELLENIFDK